MRNFLAFLLLTALIGAQALVTRRKSLGFGLIRSKDVFQTQLDRAQPFTFSSSHEDPFEVAKSFVESGLGFIPTEDRTYTIREDSYTDKNTGVSHVYLRQIINGIEVSDGDINLNVKDGTVISYGETFYHGPTPSPFFSPGNIIAHTHADYCAQAYEELIKYQSQFRDSFVLQGDQQAPSLLDYAQAASLSELEHFRESNCRHATLPYNLYLDAPAEQDEPDVRHALLQFMIAATPNPDVEQDILARFDEYLAAMTSEFETQFVGTHHVMVEKINNVPDTVSPVKAKLAYVQIPHEWDGTQLQLVWKFEVEMQDNWYETAVSFTPPHRIISVVDWASDSPIPEPPLPVPATYHIFPWGMNDPSEGDRMTVTEPVDRIASPAGWHALPYAYEPQPDAAPRKGLFWRNTTTTAGNNVFAHENWGGRSTWVNNYRPDGGVEKVFDYPYNPAEQNDTDESMAEAKKYIDTAVTQLFYTTNMVHDLFYRYGFDEVSGNFQQYNFGRGGKENDAVVANAQDGSGFNNANFMTPPDGQNGRCRMYLWNTANPYRDGDLEAGIVIHELAHGLSTRMTGGPANSGCLGWGESGGMGEGWGDFVATMIRSTSDYHDYPMGAWASNIPRGIRKYIYSLDDTINPSNYKTLDQPGYWGVHAIGEVWAEMLWVVSQKLIAKHGFVENLFPPEPREDGSFPEEDEGEGGFYRPRPVDPATGKRKGPLVPAHGNSLMIQLVLNAMKMQPCRPSFFEARDAIIHADQVLTDGENYCELWKGFAERGLGTDAKVEGRTPWGGGIRTNGYEVPLVCDYPDESRH